MELRLELHINLLQMMVSSLSYDEGRWWYATHRIAMRLLWACTSAISTSTMDVTAVLPVHSGMSAAVRAADHRTEHRTRWPPRAPRVEARWPAAQGFGAHSSSMHFTAKPIRYSVSIQHVRFELFRNRPLSSSYKRISAFAKKYVFAKNASVSIKKTIRKREKWP